MRRDGRGACARPLRSAAQRGVACAHAACPAHELRRGRGVRALALDYCTLGPGRAPRYTFVPRDTAALCPRLRTLELVEACHADAHQTEYVTSGLCPAVTLSHIARGFVARGAGGMNGSAWATAQSLGLGMNPLGDGGGRTVAMSAMRVHRLRALAVQKLAAAYKTDEIASSVMVMQGGSVFDDIAERVLKVGALLAVSMCGNCAGDGRG